MNLTKLTDDIYTLTASDKNESATVTLFYLFPGIILGINDIHMHHFIGNHDEINRVIHTDSLRINYCTEGSHTTAYERKSVCCEYSSHCWL